MITTFALLFLCGILIFPCSVSAAEEQPENTATFIELYVDKLTFQIDGRMTYLDVAPCIENDRTLVPLRAIAEPLGCTVEWEPIQRQAVIVKGTRKIVLTMDSNTAQLIDPGSSAEITLDAAPKIVDNRTMVPIRFVAENLDCQVFWKGDEQKIVIAAIAPGGKHIGVDTMISYLREVGKVDTGAVIAVIDSGVDVDHTYLQNRIVQAHNVVQNNSDVADRSGHGTKVAGVIANCTPETVKIMPIKVDDNTGNYTPEAVAEAIRYAVEKGVTAINISLSSATTQSNRIVTEAVDEAVRQGCPVIVAAGNQKDNVEGYSPANAGSAIVVTAVNQYNDLWSSSNYGNTVTLAAPGVQIVSSGLQDTYGASEGTSMAAPYVTAAVAMLRMDIPGISPDEIRNLLIRYAADLGEPGWDPWYGSGLIDLKQYVYQRKNGVIEDFTQSTQEKAALLDQEIEKLRQQSLTEHIRLYGLFVKPLFAAELVAQANRLYEAGDCFAAGYYLEAALKVYGDSTARNNLACLIRRGEYVSYQYTLQVLLDTAKGAGNAHAYVNDALLQASKNHWEEADRIIAELCYRYQGTLSMTMVVDTWNKLSYQKDAEGDLVLGWLMRYHQYEDGLYTQQEYMERALEKYPTLPDWLRQPV